jgi:maltose-binding protein MalE
MLLYNKSLVDQVPADTEAWVNQLETLTDPANGRYGLVFDETEAYWLIPWLSGFGGWPLDPEGKPALDTAEMVEALWFLHDLKFEHKVMPENADYQTAFDLFSQGKAAYVVDGMWNLDRYTGLGVNLGVAPLPRQQQVLLERGNHVLVVEGCNGDKLAAPESLRLRTAASQQQWLTKMRRLPSHKQALTSTAITSDPPLRSSAEQLRVARAVPPVLEMTCAWRGMDSYLGKVMHHELVRPSAVECRLRRMRVNDMAVDAPGP